jgi:thiamine pyrophosphate-dependent acetolactate synthase large subunit-like protein
MRVYEAIGETLKKLEVRATFGLMGDGNLRFMTHLAHELGMPYYAARHEGGAVAMADGYARVTGQVGVCSVTQGPGVTNTLTALTEARKAITPMLLLAGDTAARILRHNQDVDQTAIFKSVGVTVARVRSPDTLIIDLSRAFNQALALQQPIAISIPTDMQELACGGGASTNAEPASARGNSASRRVNRHLEAAGDHCWPRGSSFEGQGTSRTFGRADRRIAGDHRSGQGLICWEPFLRGKLWRICMGAG